VTPGAIGFKEGAIVYGHFLLGQSPETCLAAAVLDRAVMIVSHVVIGQVGLWYYVGPVMKAGNKGDA